MTARGERGIAALEFALVLPVICLLVLGAIDWGHYLYTLQVVVNAAREGARLGSVTSGTDTVALDEATNRARACLAGLPKPSVAAVSARLGTGGASVIVSIEYPSGSITGFADAIVPKAARSTAEMRRWKP